MPVAPARGRMPSGMWLCPCSFLTGRLPLCQPAPAAPWLVQPQADLAAQGGGVHAGLTPTLGARKGPGGSFRAPAQHPWLTQDLRAAHLQASCPGGAGASRCHPRSSASQLAFSFLFFHLVSLPAPFVPRALRSRVREGGSEWMEGQRKTSQAEECRCRPATLPTARGGRNPDLHPGPAALRSETDGQRGRGSLTTADGLPNPCPQAGSRCSGLPLFALPAATTPHLVPSRPPFPKGGRLPRA